MADENTLLNSDLESRYEKYKGIIKNFTLMSDIFMRNVFKEKRMSGICFAGHYGETRFTRD